MLIHIAPATAARRQRFLLVQTQFYRWWTTFSSLASPPNLFCFLVCSIIRHFPFDFINGAPARFDTAFEAVLYNPRPIIPQVHLNFNNFQTNSARRVALNTREARYLREGTTFSQHFGRPPRLASIPEPDFQQFHASSRPCWYCQKTQLPDPVKYLPKESLRSSHFRHLKYHITRMADHLGSYLYELVCERAKRPLLH